MDNKSLKSVINSLNSDNNKIYSDNTDINKQNLNNIKINSAFTRKKYYFNENKELVVLDSDCNNNTKNKL